MNYTKEGFKTLGHHTGEFNMILLERSSPPPGEKIITESVPFMQGVYDFSMMMGERIFDNRPLTYKFTAFENEYENRKIIEASLINWLMRGGYEPLYDDHARNYYYLAKCTGVDISDDTAGRRLNITVTFDAYPFKIAVQEEGNDIWDNFNFELDVWQPNFYNVYGVLSINLFNAGSVGVTPSIYSSSTFSIDKGGVTYTIPAGESKSESFRINIGENPLIIRGRGTIQFKWHKELI